MVYGMARKVISRRCSVCGRKLTVIVNEDGSYSGGHFFGKIDVTIDGRRIRGEYWECESCYKGD